MGPVTVFQGKLLSERMVAMFEILGDVFEPWWMKLLFVLLLVLIGVFIYLRKTGQDDDE